MASREGGKQLHKKLEPHSGAVTGSKRLPLPHWPQRSLLPNAPTDEQPPDYSKDNVSAAAAATTSSSPQVAADARAAAEKEKARTFAEKFAAKKMSMRAPRFMTPPENAVVREGDTAELKCVYEGLPRPAVRWFVDGLAVGALTSSTRTSPAGTRGRRPGIGASADRTGLASAADSPIGTSQNGSPEEERRAEQKLDGRKYELKHDAGQRTIALLVHNVTPEDTRRSYMCVLASHLGDARATAEVRLVRPASGALHPTPRPLEAAGLLLCFSGSRSR